MARRSRRLTVVFVAVFVLVACLVGIFMLNANGTHEASPKRSAPFPIEIQSTESLSMPIEKRSLTIEASDIVSVSASAIKLDAQVSGATSPRKTANCKGSDYCIDPPVPDQAAWYGEPPSLPSVNPVLLFGHTSWKYDEYATFNNLPALVAGDTIVVTTKTGVYTYLAEAPTLVPYNDAPQSDTIFGFTPEKLVLVTCNDEEVSATVVVAYLIDAVPV